MKRAIETLGLQLSVRAAVAAALSLAIGQLLQLEHPIYALIAAIIVTDLTPSETARRGMTRVVSTIVGAICGAGLSMLLPPGPIAIGVGVLITMLLCELLNMREGAKVAGFICGIVMFSFSDDPWRYALFRFIETTLGIAVAWALSYVPKLLRDEAK